jgi:uncharacterized membrane protein YdbT with pleckstrin-like domain
MQQEELLENGEIMLEKVRKHWIVYVEDFFIHTFGCIFFLAIAHILATKSVTLGAVWAGYTSMILVMFVIIFWLSFFYAWTKDYFDVWYVTDRHIIAIDQKQIFDRDEAFMELNRIQDVSFEKNSFLATFLDYGNLKVQSAGIEQEFIMKDVHDVEAVAHRIMELRDKTKNISNHGV